MTDDQMPQSDGVNKNAESGAARARPAGQYGLVAAISAIAGILAVYVSLPSGGNVEPVRPSSVAGKTVNAAAPAKTATAPGKNPAASLRRFATGNMATFVAKAEPTPVGVIKFNDFPEDGKSTARTMADWKGKVVLLNLWATWCPPCRAEMPDLARLKEELSGADFDLIAVSVDRTPDRPRKFLAEINASSIGLYHAKRREIAGPLKAFAYPTTVLFDGQGRELGRLVGPADWSSEDAKALIRAAIAGAG